MLKLLGLSMLELLGPSMLGLSGSSMLELPGSSTLKWLRSSTLKWLRSSILELPGSIVKLSFSQVFSEFGHGSNPRRLQASTKVAIGGVSGSSAEPDGLTAELSAIRSTG